MGTIGGLKGTLGLLTKEQRLAIKSKQVSRASASLTRHCACSLLASPLAFLANGGLGGWGGVEDGASRYFYILCVRHWPCTCCKTPVPHHVLSHSTHTVLHGRMNEPS